MSCVASSPQTKLPLKKRQERKMKENRKIPKPLIERNRRARINRSLHELEKLLVEEIKIQAKTRKNGKIEKADILEIAVSKMKCLSNFSSVSVGNEKPWRPWVSCGQTMTDLNNNSIH